MQRGEKMKNEILCANLLTIEEVCELHELGFEFVVEGGVITDVFHR